MKKELLPVTAVLAMMTVGPLALAEDAASEVQIGIADAYIPSGFNSGSDTYVVAYGIFPNGCYRWSRAEVKNTDALDHEVKTFAIVQPGMCLMVLIPFNREVRLGKLTSGTHQIRFLSGDGTYLQKQLVVD